MEMNGQSFLRRPGPTRGCQANDDDDMLNKLKTKHRTQRNDVVWQLVFTTVLQNEQIYQLTRAIHQRLLLQFLSAPDDGRKKRPKHVEYYCSY